MALPLFTEQGSGDSPLAGSAGRVWPQRRASHYNGKAPYRSLPLPHLVDTHYWLSNTEHWTRNPWLTPRCVRWASMASQKGMSGGHQAGCSIASKLGVSDRFSSHFSTNLGNPHFKWSMTKETSKYTIILRTTFFLAYFQSLLKARLNF